MKLEYVVSGTSFTRLSYKDILHGETKNAQDQATKDSIVTGIRDMFGKFNAKHPDNQVSLLFNAFVEEEFGDLLPKYEVPIYADSGGLQIITLKNKVLNDELKQEIYDTQSTIDYAMCFDEIPLYIDEAAKGNSARTSMEGKYVLSDEMSAKGKATGLNIRKQIERFNELKSGTAVENPKNIQPEDVKAKVFIILQGNRKEDWLNFAEGIRSQLDEWMYDYVEGIAVADTCIGNSVREALDMLSIVPLLGFPEKVTKRIHLLGVGSIARLLPAVVMVKTGYLHKDTHISYDSTSISSGFVFGRFLGKNKTINFPKVDEDEYNAEIDKIVCEMLDHAECYDWSNITQLQSKADWEKLFRMHSKLSVGDLGTKKCEISGDKIVKWDVYKQLILFHATYLLSQVANYTNNLIRVIETDESLKKFMGSSNSAGSDESAMFEATGEDVIKPDKRLKALLDFMSENIDKYEDYIDWRRHFKGTGDDRFSLALGTPGDEDEYVPSKGVLFSNRIPSYENANEAETKLKASLPAEIADDEW